MLKFTTFNLNEEYDHTKDELKQILSILVNSLVDRGHKYKKIKKYLSKKRYNKTINNDTFNIYNNRRKTIENDLINKGYKTIVFDKIKYELGKDIYHLDKYLSNSMTTTKNDIPKKLSLIKNPNKIDSIYDVITKSTKEPIKTKFEPNKKYDIYDIVNIVIKNSKFRSIYMGITGTDVDPKTGKNILNVINDNDDVKNFYGVFVLLGHLPDSFVKIKVRLFLLNESEVGKGKQIIKFYTNNGDFIKEMKAPIDRIDLLKKQDPPIKESLNYSLLEKINSIEIQNMIKEESNKIFEFVNFNTDECFEKI